MKKCLLIISSLACFSHIDAGWRDQWVWFKSLFSGFSIKRPSLTKRQMVIGGVGALAVAGAAWWWLKSPKKPTNKTKDDVLERRRQQEASSKLQEVEIETSINNPELPQQPQNLNPLIELTMNQSEEINNGDNVLIDFSDDFLYSGYKNAFGIVQKTEHGFEVETILKIGNKEKMIKNSDAKCTEVTLKNIDLKNLKKDDYVFVYNPIDGQKIMLIGKYIGKNQDDEDKVTVLSGSLFHNVELKERTYNVSDVFVPGVVEEKNEAVKSSVNQEELIKDTEVKKRKLEQTESDLETARREKLLLESTLANEKTNSSIKQAKDFFNQTNELTHFEQLLTQYENNKNEANKIKLTEQFNTLNSIFSKDTSKLWQTLTDRYNAIIKSE